LGRENIFIASSISAILPSNSCLQLLILNVSVRSGRDCNLLIKSCCSVKHKTGSVLTADNYNMYLHP